jgi:hypothetical protein
MTVMIYPKQLEPAGTERIILPPGKAVKIAKATPVFKLWTGKPIKDTYGGKAVLSFYRKPEFAELGILRIFEHDGWQGVWVDSYRGKFRTRFWPANSVSLPKDKELLLESIYEAAGKWAGCFDVFCWKGSNYIFAEAKRCGEDRIRDTQKRWLEAAIKCGVPRQSLLFIEWEISNPHT